MNTILYIFVGPSGSGKTTSVNKILKNNPDIKKLVSSTTRKKRTGEIDNFDYYFYDDFDSFLNEKYIEYNKFDNNLYGLNIKELETKNIYKKLLFISDPNGYKNILHYIKINKLSITVRLIVFDISLSKRVDMMIYGRNQNKDEVLSRLSNDHIANSIIEENLNEKAYLVVTDSLLDEDIFDSIEL